MWAWLNTSSVYDLKITLWERWLMLHNSCSRNHKQNHFIFFYVNIHSQDMKNEPDKYMRSIFVTILKYTAFKFVNDNITVINNQDKYKTSYNKYIKAIRMHNLSHFSSFSLFYRENKPLQSVIHQHFNYCNN